MTIAHDEFCTGKTTPLGSGKCCCASIAFARQDEREQAAQRVADLPIDIGYDAEWVKYPEAIAAARGDGDCQHDWQHLKGEKCPTCRRCGAARGGEQA